MKRKQKGWSWKSIRFGLGVQDLLPLQLIKSDFAGEIADKTDENRL